MIFDTHCHLNDEQLYSHVDEIIAEAEKVGVNKFLVVGWDFASSLLAIKMAEQYPQIYAAIGYHPCNVFNVTDQEFNELMSHINDPKVVALGEIGLDYHWNKDPHEREIQKEFFIKQIEIANQNNKPITIHNREAFEDCLEILKKHKPIHGGVMHCYSGSVESVQTIIDLGLLIGFGGTLTFINAKKPKEVCGITPLDKMVVETDAPYLSPHPLRGTINEPKNIALVIDEITNIKKMSKKHVIDVIYEASCKMFHV